MKYKNIRMDIKISDFREFNNAMADMFSQNPSIKGKIALEYYNKCWINVENACYENDINCKLEAFNVYKKN